MKTLRYRRHSSKDGAVKDTIGFKGIALAISEGDKDAENGILPGCVFHGELVRTAQTALIYVSCMDHGWRVMPVVPQIGNAALFAELANEALCKAVAGGASNFEAVIAAHGVEKAKGYAADAFEGVKDMFDDMGNDDDMGAAFGHSPIIELAAWAAAGFQDLPPEFIRLSDMEGIEFVNEDDGNGTIRIGEKITVG